MGLTHRDRVKSQHTLTGGRVVRKATVAKIKGIDTNSDFDSFLSSNHITIKNMDRYASALVEHDEALKRGESESEARQSALSAASVSSDTREKQTASRERRRLKSLYEK